MQAVVQLGKGFSRSTLDAADTCCSTFENASIPIPMAMAGPEAMPTAKEFGFSVPNTLSMRPFCQGHRGLCVAGDFA